MVETEAEGAPAAVVQVRRGRGQPFGVLDRYVPLHTGEMALYRAIREECPLWTPPSGSWCGCAAG